MAEWVGKRVSPMCGNSICQDRRFMARHMPELEAYFHYRNLDVSTLKDFAGAGSPRFAKGLRRRLTIRRWRTSRIDRRTALLPR